MKLGLVSYNLARSWDIPKIISMCEATGFEAVELRTTHAHGVEPSMTSQQRSEVRKRFADTPIKQLSLGSTCEYHSTDPKEVQKQIDITNQFVDLAADIGAVGVKVRPNGFHEGVAREKTLDQIGQALRKCGEFAARYPVAVWLEVHGRGTAHPPYIRHIMDVAKHPKVGVCWNSNPEDVVDGSVKKYFDLLRPNLMSVHINNLYNPDYPYRELFSLLQKSGYDGFCLAEIAESCEPETLMRYYKALWEELQS